MVLLKVQNLHPRTEIHMRGCMLNGCHWGQEHSDFPGAPSWNIVDIGDFCTSVGQHMIKHVPILRPNAEILANQGPTHISRIPRQSPRRNATSKTWDRTGPSHLPCPHTLSDCLQGCIKRKHKIGCKWKDYKLVDIINKGAREFTWCFPFPIR